MSKTPAIYKFLPSELAERIKNLRITVHRPLEGPRQGLHKSPHHGSSVEFAEYREYIPGDPPNLIDWAVYARSDKYMIRKFQEEVNLVGYVLLDTSESLAFQGDGQCSKMEYACFLAAGAMYLLINQGDSAGLITFDAVVQKSFPAVASLDGLRPLLLELEKGKARNKGNIESALHAVAEMVPKKSLFILISDLLQPPEEIIRGISHLHHNGHEIIVFHVMDKAEIRLPFGGLMEIRELETNERMVVEMDEIRNAYMAEVENYLGQLKKGCLDCMADYSWIDTQTAIEEALRTGVSQHRL